MSVALSRVDVWCPLGAQIEPRDLNRFPHIDILCEDASG